MLLHHKQEVLCGPILFETGPSLHTHPLSVAQLAHQWRKDAEDMHTALGTELAAHKDRNSAGGREGETGAFLALHLLCCCGGVGPRLPC